MRPGPRDPLRFAFAINNVSVIDETWTTIHLAHAALEAGHEIRLVEAVDFEITATGRLVARAYSMRPPSPGRIELANRVRARILTRCYLEIQTCDLLLLRFNPPSMAWLHYAALAEAQGVTVVNSVHGIVLSRSKAWAATLPGVPRPMGVVTGSRATAHAFAARIDGPVVVKPAMGSGGRGVTLIRRSDPRALDRALDRIRSVHGTKAVIQEYVTAASDGEKRLFWVDGEVVGAYGRQRAAGAFLHNLKQGGRPEPCVLDPADIEVADALGPHLAANGIRIAGIDVIGGRLVEVNTLNPGGVHYADSFREGPGPSIADRVVARLSATLPLSGKSE
jgi:glutathione synthase